MAWMKKLCDTYDTYAKLAGKEDNDQPILLPISHSTVNAQIEVTIDFDGNFIKELTRTIGENEESKVTIIPVTEDSASRGNGNFPHPLCDKLCYVAGDYSTYTKDNKSEYYVSYLEGLRAWVDSPYTHKMLQAVYRYLEKGCLVKDLLSINILQLDEQDILSDCVNKLQGQGQTGAFVRFCVGTEIGIENRIWKIEELYNLYIQFYANKQKLEDLCYATGKILPCSEKHPSKIRNSGDKAKLISGNDDTGFTYRGRFIKKEQAACIGYETSQKAHNALRWLIQKQGYTRDNAALVAWEVHGKEIPDIFEDSLHAYYEKFEEDDDMGMDKPDYDNRTGEYYAQKLNQAMDGYAKELSDNETVIIMALDAATPGRMSITYYQEFARNQFIRQVQSWYEKCKISRFVEIRKGKWIRMKCTPSPRQIALAAFGVERGKGGFLDGDKKLLRNTVERILPCIINENKKVPLDIVRAAVNRASNPQAFSYFVWDNQVMRVACALIKYNDYGGKEMNLNDEKYKGNRDFLFGRLLAVLDEMETRALLKDNQKEEGNNKEIRMTNAKRYWNAYTRRPAKTFATIKSNLIPYLKKLSSKSVAYFENTIQEIILLMKEDDFNDHMLMETYLPGYYCQKEEFRKSKNKNETDKTGGNENE